MATPGRGPKSLETILTYDNKDLQSQWSVMWSTSDIPVMDSAGGGTHRRLLGRRRLRIGSLTLGALLSMHCRVTASALSGGFFMFIMFLILAVATLANPLRHFEVYLGQWSISGPGRAFRMVPMLDGIGIAICINAIVRAICCCTLAAIAAVYVVHTVSDQNLPFTYCSIQVFYFGSVQLLMLLTVHAQYIALDEFFRNFKLIPYAPILTDVKDVLREPKYIMSRKFNDEITSGLYDDAGWNGTWLRISKVQRPSFTMRKLYICNETYNEYPPLHSTPAYNYFYVEVVTYRSKLLLGQFNFSLALCIILAWLTIWAVMIMERVLYGRLVWNNMYSWFIIVPWIWAAVLALSAVIKFINTNTNIRKIFQISSKEIFVGMTDALEVAIYIHAASVGTEIMHGKGLNRYASGHIDPLLNGENVWHSGHLLLFTALHTCGAMLCSMVDFIHSDLQTIYHMHEGIFWIIPMYSMCTSHGKYSHFVSTIIFSGLVFSYMTVAFVLFKTALHTIIEYRVKLVFVEQYLVGALILTCMVLSLLFATNGGIALLESVDAIMNGFTLPFICFMELICLLYVSRSHDFISDMNVATEENSCASRIGTQWQIIPFIVLATILVKLTSLVNADIPPQYMYIALAPLVAVIIAIPLRAAYNAYVFLKPKQRI